MLHCLCTYMLEGHGILVLEYLGDNLQALLCALGRVLSLDKVYKIGRVMVRSVIPFAIKLPI